VSWISDLPGGAALELTVQPRAPRSCLVGVRGDRLVIRITAPPVDDKANAALVAFLAEQLGVKRADVVLVRGDTSRQKAVRVEGLGAAEVARRLGVSEP
jgi:uncharacterized protein (TIGR00251 family)